jgi:glycosyltransferase involved in cell wall biosynthesis
MTTHYLLSSVPVPADFQGALEERVGGRVETLSLRELRRRPLLQMLRTLRQLDPGGTLFIPVEEENTAGVLAPLTILAALSSAREIRVTYADFRERRLSRWDGLKASGALLLASAQGARAVRAAAKETEALLDAPRIAVEARPGRRLLYLNGNLWFGVQAGGSVGHVAGVINAFLRTGYSVQFAAASRNQQVQPGVEFLGLQSFPHYGLPYDVNNYRFHRNIVAQLDRLPLGEFTLLYQRLSLGNYAGVVLSRRHGLPLVMEYNGSEVWAAAHWGKPVRHQEPAVKAEEVSLRHAHVVVTVSEVLKDELINRGIAAERIVCYPNCVNETVFDPESLTGEAEDVRARYGLANDAIVVGYVGTFLASHGVEVLAAAIRQFAHCDRAWLGRNKVHFLLVGDGLKMAAVRQTLSDECCKSFYTLAGLVPQGEAPQYLAACDILLSPHVPNADGSRFFQSPCKLFEYMAMGRGIVASDLDQIGEVLRDSLRSESLPAVGPAPADTKLAVLTRPGDAEDLARSIKFLVEHPDWRRTLGKNARCEALSKYTWRHHTAAILDKCGEVGLLADCPQPECCEAVVGGMD